MRLHCAENQPLDIGLDLFTLEGSSIAMGAAVGGLMLCRWLPQHAPFPPPPPLPLLLCEVQPADRDRVHDEGQRGRHVQLAQASCLPGVSCSCKATLHAT